MHVLRLYKVKSSIDDVFEKVFDLSTELVTSQSTKLSFGRGFGSFKLSPSTSSTCRMRLSKSASFSVTSSSRVSCTGVVLSVSGLLSLGENQKLREMVILEDKRM